MKRSNRLILLIGVFLAALAFVFVVIVLQRGRRRRRHRAGDGRRRRKLATVVAARDIPLGVAVTSDMLTTKTLDDRRPPDRRLRRPEPGGRPGRAGEHQEGPAGHDRALFQDTGSSRASTARRASPVSPSRSTRCPASARSSRAATTWTSIAQLSTATELPDRELLRRQGDRRPTSGDGAPCYDPVERQGAAPGPPGRQHPAAGPADRRYRHGRCVGRPGTAAAARPPSTASRRS